MSWDRGNQLETPPPAGGPSQPYMEARLASNAPSERVMPFGGPVLPDVNCTKLPGASGAPAEADDAHLLKGSTATGAADNTETSPGSQRTWVAPERAHIRPIWVRYSSASMPRAGWGNDTRVIPERSAPKRVARQPCEAVKSAATVPARPARPSSQVAARRESDPISAKVRGCDPSDRQWMRARSASGASSALTTRLMWGEQYRFGAWGQPASRVDRAGTLDTSDRRTTCNSTSTCPDSPGREALRPSGPPLRPWPGRQRPSGCARCR